MSWLGLLLAVLLPAGALSSQPPSSPRHAVAAPVRPRPCREAGLSALDVAPDVALLERVDHPRPQAANYRLAERRIRLLDSALMPDGIPDAVHVAALDGEREPQFLPPAAVPDSLERYARIIFPVPPPR